MSVLVDTSVWIQYFRNSVGDDRLDYLIDENLVVINDLILAELVPFLKARRQHKIIRILNEISRLHLVIDWDGIIAYQYKCIKNGINGIGIPDLIIAQNAKQNNCEIYSFDKHFQMMGGVVKIRLFQ
jgi:predicted nucleic acid-binding protein